MRLLYQLPLKRINQILQPLNLSYHNGREAVPIFNTFRISTQMNNHLAVYFKYNLIMNSKKVSKKFILRTPFPILTLCFKNT